MSTYGLGREPSIGTVHPPEAEPERISVTLFKGWVPEGPYLMAASEIMDELDTPSTSRHSPDKKHRSMCSQHAYYMAPHVHILNNVFVLISQ